MCLSNAMVDEVSMSMNASLVYVCGFNKNLKVLGRSQTIFRWEGCQFGPKHGAHKYASNGKKTPIKPETKKYYDLLNYVIC